MSGEKKGDEDCDFSKFAYHLAGRSPTCGTIKKGRTSRASLLVYVIVRLDGHECLMCLGKNLGGVRCYSIFTFDQVVSKLLYSATMTFPSVLMMEKSPSCLTSARPSENSPAWS